MSRRMTIEEEDQSGLLDLLARDHREFGLLNETLRDSALAGATRIEFGIHGLDPKNPSVARRYVADNGIGMDRAVMEGPYSKFGKTATTLAYDVQFDVDTNTIITKLVPYDHRTADKLHTRHGIGSRLTALMGNPTGVVTVSISEGDPLMTVQYRLATVEDYVSRTYPGNRIVVRPYKELDDLTYREVHADADWIESMILRAGDDEWLDAFRTLTTSEVLDNPFYGFDWSEIVPDWIADHRPDTGLWTIKGKPAHGTVKFLLGHDLDESTAYWGNTAFPNEAKAPQYAGFIARSVVDLSNIKVNVDVLQAQRQPSTHTVYRLSDIPGKTFRKVSAANLGQYPVRTGHTLDSVGKGWEEVYSQIWDLDDGIKAWVSVAKTPERKGFEGSGYMNSSGLGMVAVHYGNEIHEHSSTAATYKEMGVPVMTTAYKGVTVIFNTPLARYGYEAEGGIYQTTARDGPKWAGANGLPWTDWFRRMAHHPEMDVVKKLLRDEITDGEVPDLDERLLKQVSEVAGSVTPGTVDPSTVAPPKPGMGDKTLAVLEDAESVPAIEVGKQGSAAKGGERPEKKKENKRKGAGRTGPRKRGVVSSEEDSDFHGRQSLRATVGTALPEDDPIWHPPLVHFLEPSEWAGGKFGAELTDWRLKVADWECPTNMAIEGGHVNVNRRHLFLSTMDAYLASALKRKRSKRDEGDIEVIFRKHYREKIQLAYAEQLLFVNKEVFDKEKILWSIDDVVARLNSDDFWNTVFTVNFIKDTDILLGEIQTNAAAA